MKNSHDLYYALMEFLFKSAVRMHDIRVFNSFAWAVVGLVLSRSVNLRLWSQHRPGKAKAASKVRQLSRWLHNPKIEVAAIYRPLIACALQNYAGEKMVLALDTSQLWNRFVLIRVSLIYRGRAIPLVWRVKAGKSASVAFESYVGLLQQAANLLPEGAQVLFLADRGFFHRRLLHRLRDLNWRFRIRIKQSTNLYRADFSKTKLSRLMPARGEARFVHKIWLTDHRLGPLFLALAHVQTKNGYEQWAIVSDEPTDLRTFDEYGQRFNIEENFLDDKSNGFQLESSLIREAQALSRLCLILATATLYLVSTGVSVVTLGLRPRVDSHWKRGLSYLKIGWGWVIHALSENCSLLRFPWLDPAPDPQPVFASKAQAARPRATLYAITLLL